MRISARPSPASKVEYTPGGDYTGAREPHLSVAPGADHIGEVQAWNVDTGKRVWTHTYANSQNWGPMLATGGGLVFSGGTNDRKFHAFDASSGTLLWEFPTNSGITGQPSHSWWTANSTSPCNPAGASTPAECSSC